MNARLGKTVLLSVMAAGTLVLAVVQPAAMAEPTGAAQSGSQQKIQERMQARADARLDKLAERLEIKSSQQAAWDAFAKSVETLTEHRGQRPDEQADAATVARYRAERANDVAGKLARVAETTAKLQAVLDEDQRKILNRVAHRFQHEGMRHARWQGRGSQGQDGCAG